MLDLGLLSFANEARGPWGRRGLLLPRSDWEVAEVGDRAGKEYGLEKTLNKMKARSSVILRLAVLLFEER